MYLFLVNKGRALQLYHLFVILLFQRHTAIFGIYIGPIHLHEEEPIPLLENKVFNPQCCHM